MTDSQRPEAIQLALNDEVVLSAHQSIRENPDAFTIASDLP